ncbi:MAG: helix-turn-helix transcriptional regulator [Bacteroidales bacterium]
MIYCGINECTKSVISIENKLVLDVINSGMYESFELDNWMLLFVLNGQTKICLDQAKFIELKTSQMVLLPVNSFVTISALSDIQVIKCSFYNSSDFKIGNYIEGLSSSVQKIEADIPVLSINEPMSLFLSFITGLGDRGINCPELNRLLIDELFILLRAYYSANDLALLFSKVIAQSFDFKSFIIRNYKGKDIQSLAEACNMSIATFNRRFRENFGESALQWINKRKAETIFNDLRQTRKSLIEIADEHQFSSTSYLTTFCKKYFNNTPEQIRSWRNCKVSFGI